jgi:hypothetical protein
VGVEELDVTAVGEAERQFEAVDGDTEADPGRAVARSFALTLPAEARERLRAAAEDRDVVVAGTGGRVVLAGTVAGLRSLAGSVDEPPALAAALARVRDACR